MSKAKGKAGKTRSTRLSDLVRLLDQLRAMYEELLTLIDRKIDAMRKADLDAMRSCQESEQELTRGLNEREGLRRQLMDALGSELGLPPHAGRGLGVSQLAAKLHESQRSPLIRAVDGLKGTIAKVAQANRVAGVISRELVHHLRWVFAAVQPRDEKPAGYCGKGAVVSPRRSQLFETVG